MELFAWNGYGSRSGKVMPIRPDSDLDPQHWKIMKKIDRINIQKCLIEIRRIFLPRVNKYNRSFDMTFWHCNKNLFGNCEFLSFFDNCIRRQGDFSSTPSVELKFLMWGTPFLLNWSVSGFRILPLCRSRSGYTVYRGAVSMPLWEYRLSSIETVARKILNSN